MASKKTPEQQLKEIKEKKAKLEAREKKIQAEMSVKARKIETRKKILIGAMVLKKIREGDDDLKKECLEELDSYLTADRDRALFNLEPLPPEPEPEAHEPERH